MASLSSSSSSSSSSLHSKIQPNRSFTNKRVQKKKKTQVEVKTTEKLFNEFWVPNGVLLPDAFVFADPTLHSLSLHYTHTHTHIYYGGASHI